MNHTALRRAALVAAGLLLTTPATALAQVSADSLGMDGASLAEMSSGSESGSGESGSAEGSGESGSAQGSGESGSLDPSSLESGSSGGEGGSMIPSDSTIGPVPIGSLADFGPGAILAIPLGSLGIGGSIAGLGSLGSAGGAMFLGQNGSGDLGSLTETESLTGMSEGGAGGSGDSASGSANGS